MFYYDKKKFKGILLLFIACLIHLSMYVFFVVFMLAQFFRQKKFIQISSILFFFLYFIFLLNRFDSEIQLLNSKMCLNCDSANAIIIERKVLLYKIIFYEEKDGYAPVWDFLEKLRVRANKSKDCRIQYSIFYRTEIHLFFCTCFEKRHRKHQHVK